MQGNKCFFILAVMFLCVLYLPNKINQQIIDKSHTTSNQYDEMLVNATSDASMQLIYAVDDYSNDIQAEGKKVDYRNINLNLDKSLDRFYRTLYLNLNIENDYSRQESIKYQIPIKIATGYDGYYLSYFTSDGEGEKWSDLKKYSMVDDTNNLVIFFTVEDKVTVIDHNTDTTATGKFEDFKNKYPKSCFKDKKTFYSVRNQVINSMIKDDLEYYTYYSNRIAQTNNWNIRFNLPYWGDRAVEGIAFIAFYQGQAFIGSDKTYNTYGYATSHIVLYEGVYGYEKNGRKLYSEKILGDNPVYFSSKYEAASNGYEPNLQIK